MRLDVAELTCRGGREHNEDAVWSRVAGDYAALLVADGLGGCDAGEIASAAARDAFAANVCLTDEGVTAQKLAELTAECQRAICEHPSQNHAMRSTFAAMLLSPKGALMAHVGDSRLYQLRGDQTLYQSVDHSVSQIAVLSGEIKPSEIRHHRDRNKLYYTLGGDALPSLEPDALTDVRPGDGFLLCSDGFWENVLELEMCFDLLKSETAAAWLDSMLARLARRVNGKHDNFSAVALICQEG